MYEETNQRLDENVFLYETKLGLTSPNLHLTCSLHLMDLIRFGVNLDKSPEAAMVLF